MVRRCRNFDPILWIKAQSPLMMRAAPGDNHSERDATKTLNITGTQDIRFKSDGRNSILPHPGTAKSERWLGSACGALPYKPAGGAEQRDREVGPALHT